MATIKNSKGKLRETGNACELNDDDIENVVGGVNFTGFDASPALNGRVGKPGATTVSECPVCGAGEETFAVLSVAELKYKCPCGAVLKYDKTKKCFCRV